MKINRHIPKKKKKKKIDSRNNNNTSMSHLVTNSKF